LTANVKDALELNSIEEARLVKGIPGAVIAAAKPIIYFSAMVSESS